jgi:hypothetical protein
MGASVTYGRVRVGGWHDFRHTLNRGMRRAGVHPVVISGILGHKSVTLAAEVYDRATAADIGQARNLVGQAVAAPIATFRCTAVVNLLKVVSAVGIETTTY